MRKTMRKLYFSFIGVILLTGALYAVFGFHFLQSRHMEEYRLVQNLAGAVLTKNPGLEEAFVSALNDTDYRGPHRENAGYGYLEEGREVLSKYGYDAPFSLPVSEKCIFAGILLLFVLSAVLLVTAGFMLFHKKRETQQEQILTLLDKCLEEDYSFLARRGEMTVSVGEVLADTLFKLGNKLQIKTSMLAEERDHTKTLVTDISHQLKSPLAALKNCFLMYREAETREERDEFSGRCEMQIDKLENLIAALISVSRLETGMIALHPEKADLMKLLAGAVDTVYMKAVQKNIEIEVYDCKESCHHSPGDEEHDSRGMSPKLCLDSKWTTEALANILDNAVKYSPPQSRIMLRVQRLYSHISIEIEDEGVGILKSEYNRIFKRFYRGENAMVKNAEGVGVGLYLARKIIEEQGGTVTVKPAQKQGSIFVVCLPVSDF